MNSISTVKLAEQLNLTHYRLIASIRRNFDFLSNLGDMKEEVLDTVTRDGVYFNLNREQVIFLMGRAYNKDVPNYYPIIERMVQSTPIKTNRDIALILLKYTRLFESNFNLWLINLVNEDVLTKEESDNFYYYVKENKPQFSFVNYFYNPDHLVKSGGWRNGYIKPRLNWLIKEILCLDI